MLAVVLLIYQLVDPANVEITWETATENRTAGFNIYRSSKPEGEFILINEGEFIDSRGGPISGAQ